MKEIANRYDMSWDTIRKMFRAHNTPWISRQGFQRRARSNQYPRIWMLLEQGLTRKQIAAAMSTYPRRISKIIAENADQPPGPQSPNSN